MTLPAKAGAVLYAIDIARMSAFYVEAAGLGVTHREVDNVVVESPSLRLVIVAIPPALAASIAIATPPIRRIETPIKLVFPVASLSAARVAAARLGGELNPVEREWQYLGEMVCDGHDPEGNVTQFRESVTDRRPLRTYRGSCHCGAITFEIDSDFPELTMCDCSICRRRNALMVKVHQDQFRLLSGESSLVEYQFHTMTARHFFCRSCGIYPFHRKRVTPDCLGINVSCLHDFDPTGIPVRLAAGASMK